jgi:hypothetical protein
MNIIILLNWFLSEHRWMVLSSLRVPPRKTLHRLIQHVTKLSLVRRLTFLDSLLKVWIESAVRPQYGRGEQNLSLSTEYREPEMSSSVL